MNQKRFVSIVLIVLVVILMGTVGYLVFMKTVVNNEITIKPFISPLQKIIDSGEEIEFIFSAWKETIHSRVYLHCESGLSAYFSDNLAPRPPKLSNICNSWQEKTWNTDMRTIKFVSHIEQETVATLQMTITM